MINMPHTVCISLRNINIFISISDNIARKYNANHFNNSDSNSSSSNDCNVIGQPIIQLECPISRLESIPDEYKDKPL